MTDKEKIAACERKVPIWDLHPYYETLMKLNRKKLLAICDLPEIGLTFFCPALGDTDPLAWRRATDKEQIVLALLSDYGYDNINQAFEKVTGEAISAE